MLNIYSFAKIIRDARAKKGISQEQLAEKLQISRISINNYEKGRQIPSLDIAMRIAIFLEISLDDLLKEAKEDPLQQSIEQLESTKLSKILKNTLKDDL